MSERVGPRVPDAVAAPALLRLERVGKRFGTLQALDDVTLEIAAGEIHCLLGENGAGKSTLCNVVFGLHRPDVGSMRLDGREYRPSSPADALVQRVAMVHQHFSLVDDASVVDNMLLGSARGVLDPRACAARVDALSARFGLDVDASARIEDLSVGERQRVEIVKCLMREPRLLVLDEPTAVLLPDEIRALLAICRRVADGGCGVVLVTHKLAEIRDAADRATVLRGGRVVACSDRPAAEIGALVRAMIQKDLETPATGRSVVSPVAAPPMPGPARPAHVPRHASGITPRGTSILQVDGLTVRDADGVVRVDSVTLEVAPGEIVAVAGVEGNGQSELAAALSGMRAANEGRFFVGSRELTHATPRALAAAGLGVVPEDRHAVGCVLGMSVAENLFLDRLARFSRWGVLLDRARLAREAVAQMTRFDVRAAGPWAAFSSLSGGNQQKAVLARELGLPGLRVLLAAHPTRGLDVGAVQAVYGHIRAACERGAGVLLISSELDELFAIADRMVVMYRGRVMGECRAASADRERVGAWMAGQAA